MRLALVGGLGRGTGAVSEPVKISDVGRLLPGMRRVNQGDQHIDDQQERCHGASSRN